MTSPPRLADACAPDAGRCTTCSDEAVPVRVVALPETGLQDGAVAVAICEDARGHRQEVLVGLVGRVRPGDRLLVHAGAALGRLPAGAAP